MLIEAKANGSGQWAEHLSQLIENKTTGDLGGGMAPLPLRPEKKKNLHRRQATEE